MARAAQAPIIEDNRPRKFVPGTESEILVIERPKYLEYRHRRDQITQYSVKRSVSITLAKPAAAFLRLVGKKTSAKTDTYEEEWMMELRISDVRPDYSALVKTQVTDAKKLVGGEEVSYDGPDPTTEFLNETVDQFGRLTEHHGTLPTPHILCFPEDPQSTGSEWEMTREENQPTYDQSGQRTGHQPMAVTYRCRIDGFGDDGGVEYADCSVSGFGRRGEEGVPVWQEFTVTGNVRYAIRDGHMLNAQVSRSLANHLVEENVLTIASEEKFLHASQGTEKTVGGMRL